MLAPTIMPRTISLTNTWPGSARSHTRLAMVTANPAMSSPRTSTSPVWTPARSSSPMSLAPARISAAQRSALPVASKV
jgi:hypothetical protein